MAYEPTPQERQKRAFALLHDAARTSHQEGDGLQVNHLCEIAFQEAMRLAGRKQLLLALHELQWMLVLKLYWLVSGHALYTVEETLKNIAPQNENDNRAVELIKIYYFLVSQPLSNQQQAFEKLKSLDERCFGLQATPEMIEVAVHLIELMWIRSVDDNPWVQLADKWSNIGEWIAMPLKSTKERLIIQRRLTSPDRLHPVLTEFELEKLKEASPMGELWLLHLLSDVDTLHRRIQEASIKIHSGAYQWRIFADFWHANIMKINQQGEDTQGVWLARRRKLTTDYPLLVFQDRRELQIGEQLQELHRKKKEASASTRWTILQLAALHELAALRYWDYGLWREAKRAQSETLLDAAQWDNPSEGLTIRGLLYGLRAGVIQSSDKDPLTAAAIRVIEFSAVSSLETLADGIFHLYPIHRHQAADLLEDIADLLPSITWGNLGVWTTQYAQQSRTNRGMGWRMNPLKLWIRIFPSLDGNSPVWQTLHSEMMLVAQNTFLWNGNDTEIIVLWLAFAPQDLANTIAEAMRNVTNTDESDSFARARIICRAENLRGKTFREWTKPMLKEATIVKEQLLLAQHLDDENTNKFLSQIRSQIGEAISAGLAMAVPPADTKTFSGGSFPSEMYLIEEWTLEELPILQGLIVAINSSNVIQFWLPQIISAAQWLVSHGPKEFAEMIRAHLKQWLLNPPKGRSANRDSHAFTTFRINDNSFEELPSTLGWLVLQLHRKLGSVVDDELFLWVEKTMTSGQLNTLDLSLKMSLILVLQSTDANYVSRLAMLHAIMTTLKIRSHDSEKSARFVSDALNDLAGNLSQEKWELFDWTSTRGQQLLKILFDMFELWLPELSLSTSSEIRAATARLLRSLQRWNNLSQVLSIALGKLESDNRAYVRFEAAGGWWKKDQNS